MEEKERYVIRYDLDYNQCLIDTEENQGVGDYIQIVKLLNQQDKRIKELEEELDDAKRDYIPKLEFGLQRANKMGRDAEKENQQLKQQLEEKDKEISNLNGLVRERDKQIKNLKTNKKRVIEHKNKTKISFALEQLEKVKEKFGYRYNSALVISSKYLSDFIDNQIKQLKEVK